MRDRSLLPRALFALSISCLACSESPPQAEQLRRDPPSSQRGLTIVGVPPAEEKHRHGFRSFEVGIQTGREGEGHWVELRADGCFSWLESAGMQGQRECRDCTDADVDQLFARVAALAPAPGSPRARQVDLSANTLDGTERFHGDALEPVLQAALAIAAQGRRGESACNSDGPAL